MNLARMMTDKVFFEDKNGARSGPYKTKFGTDRITVFQDELHVAEGDRVIQPLPDGSEQLYIAEAIHCNAARGNIPAHYSITIAKETASPMPGTTLTTANARAGNDNHAHLAALIQSFTQGIENSNFPADQKDEAKRLLHALIEHPVVAAVLGT